MHNIEGKIKLLTDEEMLSYWRRFLWADRQDPIRSRSSMLFEGGYNMQIYNLYPPEHAGLFVNDVLVGCNSSHATSETDMRSRGLFIEERYRGLGLSKILFAHAEDHARRKKCSRLWSYPKDSALAVYEKYGFRVYRSDQSHHYVWKPVTLEK